MKQILLLILGLFYASGFLYATHIVGGEITYVCLGNDEYAVRLTVYRDCYNGQPPFDNPASLGVYDADWNLIQDYYLYVNPDDTLPVVLENPCLVAPPNVCVHRTSYTKTIRLPYRPGGYTLVYQRCCRNQLIRNLPDPLNTGISIIAYISDQTMKACNSAAVFNKWPPVAICVHEPIDFDHSATDPDGDSLVYRLCTPLNGPDSLVPQPDPPFRGPYLEVKWNDPPYNLSNVLGGDPLTINPSTGWMTGVPDMVGNFVVGVCVDEYRGGELISTTRRDFQYNVADCGTPTAAFFAPANVCENEVVKFTNQSAALTYKWYFDWPNNPNLTSNERSPSYQFPDTGTYKVALIVAPGEPCADTMVQEIHVGDFHIDAAFTLETPLCDNNGMVVQAFNKSVDTIYGIASWQWRLTGPSGFNIQTGVKDPTFVVTKPGSYKLRLVAVSNGGCRDTLTRQFNAPIPELDSLQEDLSMCVGDTVRLNSGADPGLIYAYTWSPPGTLSDTLAADPLAFPLTTTDYFVTVVNGNCTFNGIVTVHVYDTSALSVSAAPTTIYQGETAQLTAVYSGTEPILWSPAGSLSNPKSLTPLASPTETTTYTATILLSSGCVLQRFVTIVVLTPLCKEPFVFLPTGFSPNGDGENDVLKLETRFATEAYWAIYNRWGQKIFETSDLDGAWDGTYKGEPQPVDTYGYYLRVRCPGGTEWVKKGNITLLR